MKREEFMENKNLKNSWAVAFTVASVWFQKAILTPVPASPSAVTLPATVAAAVVSSPSSKLPPEISIPMGSLPWATTSPPQVSWT